MRKLKTKIQIVKDACHEKIEAVGDKIDELISEYEEEATGFVKGVFVAVIVVEAAYIHGVARGYMRVIKKRGY